MELKIQQIGNSLGEILPKEELVKRGLQQGDTIEIEFADDPFWAQLKQHSKADRIKIEKSERELSADDLEEWKDL
jgi:antitoxin component of MazEF toxin-antitoxin module